MFRKTKSVTIGVIVFIIMMIAANVYTDTSTQYGPALIRITEGLIGVSISFLIGYWVFRTNIYINVRASIRRLETLYVNTVRLHHRLQDSSTGDDVYELKHQLGVMVEGLVWQSALIVNSIDDWADLDKEAVSEFRGKYGDMENSG